MKAVALDTNLLVLLLVGRVAPGLVGHHKRLRDYNVQDFKLLVDILGRASDLITIPQCIAEVSNLAVQGVTDPLRSEILLGLRILVNSATESEIASRRAADQNEFIRLGITESAWLLALEPKATFVTSDTDLYLAALSRGYDAVRFSDLR